MQIVNPKCKIDPVRISSSAVAGGVDSGGGVLGTVRVPWKPCTKVKIKEQIGTGDPFLW